MAVKFCCNSSDMNYTLVSSREIFPEHDYEKEAPTFLHAIFDEQVY